VRRVGHAPAKAGAYILLILAFAILQSYAAEHHGLVKFGGLPIPGVAVTATQGQQKFIAITDPQGIYSFPELPEGVWTIQVEMLGFGPIRQDVTIGAGGPNAEWELKMLPLDQIHAEVVSSPAPAPAAAKPAAAQPAAPGPTRQGFQRAEVNASSNATPSSGNEPATSGAFANLSPEDLNQRAADGLLINGSVNNGAASPFAQLAAFGNNRRGVRPLYTGGIGVIVDNSALNARSYSLTGQDTPTPSYSRLLGSATLGGPLRIPHLIRNGPTFFIGYQRTQNRNATTQTTRMPTALERSGNLSAVRNTLGQPMQIFDPVTGLPFPGNVIPQNRIAPQARALLSLYPLPNFDGNAGYNYQIPIVDITHQDSLQSRFNKAVNQKNQFAGNFDYQSTRTDNPNLFDFLDTTKAQGINAAVGWTYRPVPRFSATFRYQFSRLATRTTPYFTNRLNVSGQAGISGNNQESVNWGPPALSFSGGIASLSDAQYSFNRNQTSSISYSSFWNRGRHNITFGADYRRLQFNVLSQQDARGAFTFTGEAAGSDFADFLLGTPDTSSIAFGNADKYFRQSLSDAFITDDWRMTGSLTLNAGARWEYEAPMTELYGRLVNLDIAPGFAAVAPVVAGNAGNSLVHPDRGGIQPRVSFAWRPVAASSLIVRGGYGVYRNTSVYQSIAIQMAQQSPLSKSLSVQNTPANRLTLASGFNTSPGITPNTFAIDPNFRVGYAQTWQLSIQRDLPAALQMTAMYMGTKGTRLMQEFLPHTFPAGGSNPCPACPTGYLYLSSNGNSNRHSGQIQLRRRLRSGFTANAQYTFSKAIDNAPLMAGGQMLALGQGSPAVAQNWLDLKGERALSNFDQRHQLTVQTQYTTGVGVRGGALLSGWKGSLFKEWTFAAQMMVGSGLPQTPTYPAAVRGTGVTGSIRPDTTGASIYAPPSGLHLNPSAYRAPAPDQWGNAGRNSITGPSQFDLNASLGRTFPWRDRYNVDLRVDARNVLNHVTFQSWNTTITNVQFGLPNRPNPMRSLQTTLRLRF
jgi:hypothetical protein